MSQGDDHPGLLGQRDELRRGQLPALYRPSKVLLKPQALERVVHPKGEDLVAVLTLALAPVHGYVRPSHELLSIVLAGLARSSHHDSDAARDDGLVSIHLKGGTQVLFDPRRDAGSWDGVF